MQDFPPNDFLPDIIAQNYVNYTAIDNILQVKLIAHKENAS